MTKVDRDIMVLANPEIAGLPNWVIALVAAGGLAAALSTAAGLLLAISSAVSHDLIKGMIAPDISEKKELLASRISMAGAIVLAGYLGLNPPGFAAQVVALAFGIAAASIFPALMMGIFNKNMNREGAIVGVLDPGLHLLVQGLVLHPWHRDGPQYRGQLVHGHFARGLRRGRRRAELPGGIYRLQGDQRSTGAHSAPGGGYPRSQGSG
jgi:Na+(H+)/acetate symporter ActP